MARRYITNEILIEDTGAKNAGSKARIDALEIFSNRGYEPLNLHWAHLENRSIFNLLKLQIKAKKEFKQKFNSLQKGDTLIIQYPNVRWLFSIGKLLLKLKQRGIYIGILIHDIPSLRSELEMNASSSLLIKILRRMEDQCFRAADTIISHNEKMSDYLEKRGVNPEKIINLQLFDYLIKESPNVKTEDNPSIIVAGNLAKDKAGYLNVIPQDLYMNLFGVGFEGEQNNHVKYYGSFLPDELIKNLKGNFGLVWDGNSTNGCTGAFGEYMKFNNPHKTSLYLACDLPVIIWKEAALATFIEENKCGITVSNLNELSSILDTMTESQYIEMKNNASLIGKQLRSGYFTSQTINKLEEKF